MKSSSTAARISIVLGEDHPVVIEGLQAYFAPKSIHLAHIARNVNDLYTGLQRHPQALLVTETKLDGQDMFAILGQLADENRCPAFVFFAYAEDPVNLARALAISAGDYVTKSEGLDVLEAAVKRVARGERADPNRPISQRRIQLISARPELDGNLPVTHRELQVLRHVAMGLSNREIGRSLGISVETTKEHVQNILRKLDVNDRTQAAIWAHRNKLL
jgi:DNA-binding NarL/FixJ family response regulator